MRTIKRASNPRVPSIPERCIEKGMCLCSGGEHVMCLEGKRRDASSREALLSLGQMGSVVEQAAEQAAKRASAPSKFRLTRHAVDSRNLLEFSATDDVWRHIAKRKPLAFGSTLAKDCIAKITPPAGTPEGDVLTLENYLYSQGARAVRRMPAPPEDKVVAESSSAAPTQEHRTLMQVAVDRAKRAVSVDTPALVELVKVAMTHGGA